jgi:hypothetical protein
MKRSRIRVARIVGGWTLFMLLAAILLAIEALISINQAEQACFFNYPATPCPGGDDPAVTRLTLAFFAVPLGWLIGLGVIGLGWSLARRRGV